MRKHPGCQQLPFTLKHRLTSTKLACDQGQLAASRGRRRETPGDPRPSACASMTHPGYFGDARHDRTIGVWPLPRAAPENVRKLLVGDGEQPKNVCVVSGRRSRATRQQEHAPSRTCWITCFKQIRGSLGRHLRREPSKPATRDAASNVSGKETAKQRGPRTAPKGAKHPSSTHPHGRGKAWHRRTGAHGRQDLQ